MANPTPVIPEQSAPECHICGGTGWKMIENPGKPSRAARCDCYLAKRADRVLRLAGIPPRYQECALSDFDIEFEGADRSLAKARLIAGRFVEEYHRGTDGLLFVGPTGVGKTHLAVGIINELVRSKGVRCFFSDYRELLKEIQNSYNPTVDATEMQILGPVLEAEVLVLDDLGAVKPSQWVWDTVSYVINHRYNERNTTIITTNFPDLPAATIDVPAEGFSQTERAKAAARSETLGDRITDRMLSRLHEMCHVVELSGKDFRMGPRRRR
jgi:DNA replication protein DnaC